MDNKTKSGVQRVLVTGARTGLGRMIIEEARNAGFSTIGVDQEGDLKENPEDESDIQLGDMTDPVFLSTCVQDVEHIIHTAIDRRPRVSYDELAVSNIEIPKRMFETAESLHCRTFLHLSSARICASTGKYVTEASKVEAGNSYEQTLYDAEIVLRGIANRRKKGPRLIILRTAAIYGQSIPPIGSTWLALPPILNLFFNLVPGIAGGPRTHWVHARDVARASIHLISRTTQRSIETYHLADDTALTIGEFTNLLIEAYGYNLGIKIPFPSQAFIQAMIPHFDNDLVLHFLDSIMKRLWNSVREQTDISEGFQPELSAESLATVFKDSIISNDKLKDTGFQLETPNAHEGMNQFIRSCQKQGYLPDPEVAVQHYKNRKARFETTYRENLRGRYSLSERGTTEKNIQVSLRISMPNLRLPMREHLWELDGKLRMEDFARDVEIEGTLDISLFGRRKLVYQFWFRGDDGRRYRLEGIKRVTFRNLWGDLTQLPFNIWGEKGRKIASGTMKCDIGQGLYRLLSRIRIKKISQKDSS